MTNQQSAAEDTQLPDACERQLANLEARLAEVHALVVETHSLAAATHRQVTARPAVDADRTRYPEDGWHSWLMSFFLPMLLTVVLIGGTAYMVRTFS